jgi:hypothetical protein
VWTRRLVLFLRIMAHRRWLKGIYHCRSCSASATAMASTFEQASMQWQAATCSFAVIDLVAAVGLWLAAGVGRRGVAHRFDLDGGDRVVLSAGLWRAVWIAIPEFMQSRAISGLP